MASFEITESCFKYNKLIRLCVQRFTMSELALIEKSAIYCPTMFFCR